MLKSQKGFTLIELVMVIVILGILAAVAIPKYVDMKSDAEKAAASGVYGGAQAAAATNFAGNVLGKGLTPITSGATLVSAMTGTPDGWTVGASTLTEGTYVITIDSGESTTAPAVLSKSW